jgi:hypothetical protein
MNSYETDGPFSGKGTGILESIKEEIGYLSAKDKLLIFDAVLLVCDAFLTMDERLKRNAENIKKNLP